MRAFLFLLLVTSLKTAAADPNLVFVTLKTSMGNVRLKLFKEQAPRAVKNFVELATGKKSFNEIKTGKKIENTPFYKNMIFHKVHPDLGIQTGCPLGNGKGWPGFTLRNETNEIKFDKGFLMAMAKVEGNPDSMGSQFFITVKPAKHLNGKYTVMGEVVAGHEVVKNISLVKSDAMMKPVEPVKLLEVVVDEK